MAVIPNVRYVRNGDVTLAYQITGKGLKNLVGGSGLSFEDAGEHGLKGVPDRWRLFRVTS